MKQQKIATFKGKYHEKQSTNYKRSDAQGNTKILQKFKKNYHKKQCTNYKRTDTQRNNKILPRSTENIMKSNARITKEMIQNETTKY